MLKLPLREILDWWIWIGLRYLATLLLTPYYFLKGLFAPGLKDVSDKKFQWYFNKTMLAKFLSDKFDEVDKAIFKEQLLTNKQWYIVDFDAVKVVKPFKGIYCSASKTLLYKEGNEFNVVCIYIDESKEIFAKEDGDAWELAKYFVLQGGALCSTLVTHPNLHFPVDSINAIIKTSLPKNHILSRLLFPHLRFTLPLENAVLNYKSSLLQEKWWMVYAPYPAGPKGLRELLVEGYKGIKGNVSYPPFSYPMKAPQIETDYGIYLSTYYGVIQRFVENIVCDIPKNEVWTTRWANYIHEYVPDFPNGEQIFEGDNLVRAVTSYLFIVTVGHSVDHYNYGRLDKREIPLRIRQSAPHKKTKMIKRSALCSASDLMKYYMADNLFFGPTTVTSLIETKYKFNNKEHQKAVEIFKDELKYAERNMLIQGITYMPLKKIAASIQF